MILRIKLASLLYLLFGLCAYWEVKKFLHVCKTECLEGMSINGHVEKTHTDQIIIPVFLLPLKTKPSKVATAKYFFPSLCVILYTACFDKCFLFDMITGRHYFLYKFIVTQRFFATVMLLHSLKQVFLKKSVFYFHYPHKKITMLLAPNIQTKASTS